jgi:hypothetical protein
MRELTESELETLEFLGRFGPTVDPLKCESKGYMHDSEGGGKVYLSSPDLRALADDLTSIAQWLDERATEAETKEKV